MIDSSSPRRWGSRLWLVVALLAWGCGTVPKESFYTLSAAAASLPANAAGPSVYVHRVSVPETVDRTPMVLRTGPNQVDVEDFHRWAEPLKTAIPRVIADNLMRELGSTRVRTGRQGSPGEFDYRVAVEITRFESSLDDGAQLEAAWTVTPKTGAARTGRTVARERSASRSHEAVAAAHSRALEQLSREIAAAIK